MKNILTKKTLMVLLIAFGVQFMVSCGDNGEAEKNNAAKLAAIMDSTKRATESMAVIQDSLQQRVKELSQKEGELLEKVKMQSEKELKNTILEYSNMVKAVDDSLNLITNNLSEYNTKIENLENKRKFVGETKEKSKENVATNVSELETKITTLNKQIVEQNKKVQLAEKGIDILKKKNDLLDSEIDYHKTEIDNLYKEPKSQDKIKEVNAKIVAIEAEIEKNKNSSLENELALKMAQNSIADLNKQIAEKQKLFKTEYEKNTGFESFVNKETEALNAQIKTFQEKKIVDTEVWKKLNFKKELLASNLEALNTKLATMLGIPLPSETVKDSAEAAVTKTTEEVSTNSLADEGVNKLKNEAEKNANKVVEELEAEDSEGSGITFYVIFLLVILVLLGLYFLGKRSAKKKL